MNYENFTGDKAISIVVFNHNGLLANYVSAKNVKKKIVEFFVDFAFLSDSDIARSNGTDKESNEFLGAYLIETRRVLSKVRNSSLAKKYSLVFPEENELVRDKALEMLVESVPLDELITSDFINEIKHPMKNLVNIHLHVEVE